MNNLFNIVPPKMIIKGTSIVIKHSYLPVLVIQYLLNILSLWS